MSAEQISYKGISENPFNGLENQSINVTTESPEIAQTRQLAAKILFNQVLLGKFYKDAEVYLPLLLHETHGNRIVSTIEVSEAREQYVAGLVYAYTTTLSKNNIPQTNKLLDDKEMYFYPARVNHILNELREEETEISKKVYNWHPSIVEKREKKIERKARISASKFSRGAELLHELVVELPEEEFRDNVIRNALAIRAAAVTTTLHAVNNYGLEATAISTSVLAVKELNNLLANVDAKSLLLFLLGSYYLWYTGLKKSSKENYALQKEGDFGINLLSDIFYKTSKLNTDNEATHEFASRLGPFLWEAAKEIIYWKAEVLVSGHLDARTIAFITVSNLVASGWEHGLAIGIQQIRENVIPEIKQLSDQGKTTPQTIRILMEKLQNTPLIQVIGEVVETYTDDTREEIPKTFIRFPKQKQIP